MPRAFHVATAELLVSAVEAVVIRGASVNASFVAEFCDVLEEQAQEALALGTDIGFLNESSGTYDAASPLARLLATPTEDSKAAVLRAFLESFEPFVLFRDRIEATTMADAARQVKVMLDLDAHREQIKDTLISLGTYAGALVTDGGGRYRPADGPMDTAVQAIGASASSAAAAEARVRVQLTESVADRLDRPSVLLPLRDAVRHGLADKPRESVLNAGNAVESFLTAIAGELGVNIVGAHGIGSKADRFRADGVQPKLPKKLHTVASFLSDVRNAADHGVDQEIGRPWLIQDTTGVEYPLVACSFIRAVRHFYDGADSVI